MKKFVLIITIALILCLAACALAQGGTREVIDHAGNAVTVPEQIDSIVVTDILPLPSVLTVFFDSAQRIRGMSPTSMAAAANGLLGVLYPEILSAETGFMQGSSVNVEELMKLEPDVVFYSASNPELGRTLTNAGFAAVAISVNQWGYDCVQTLSQWIALLSEIFPDNDRTALVDARAQAAYALVQERVSSIPEEERARAFFLFTYDDTTLTTSGASFFGQWWAEATGCVNVAREIETDNAVAVNMEQVYAWNPSIVFITNFNAAQPQDLMDSDAWRAVDAVASGNVHKMPLGMYRSYTPGVDTPITLLWMAKAAYPELFADIDIQQEAVDYYRDVFGVELTGEQAASIFNPPSDVGNIRLD